jgi:hypothetical protein
VSPKWKMLLAVASLSATQAVAAQPIYYDCDTPGAKYSEIKLTQSGSDYRVQGTITPMELRPASGWRPTATVYITSGTSKNYVAVQLMNDTGKTLAAAMELGKDGAKRRADADRARVGAGVSFDIYVPKAGGGFVSLGGKRVPIDVDLGPDAKVSITCSSGHFRFDPLDWSWQPLP